MKVRINDIDSLILIAENDAEQALIDHWQGKTTYTYNHYDELGSGVGIVFCDDDAPKEFVREEEEEEENPFIKLQLRIKKVVEQFNEAFGGVDGVDMADVRDMLKNIITPTPAAEQELQDVGIEPPTSAKPNYDEDKMVKEKVAEYGKWTNRTVTMFNNATVTSAPTPKLSLWGNAVVIEEQEPIPLVIQVDEATAAKIKAAWGNCMGGVSTTSPVEQELQELEEQELAKEVAELEELKVFFEDCLAEQELLGRATTTDGNSHHTTRMFNAALNMVRDLLGEEYEK